MQNEYKLSELEHEDSAPPKSSKNRKIMRKRFLLPYSVLHFYVWN